jgi:hypothetical protein
MKTSQQTNNRCNEPTSRERRIRAGYRRLLRAILDGKGGESKVQRPKPKVRRSKPAARAAMDFLSRFLCAGLAVLLLTSAGCVGPRPLKGGKASTTRSQAGLIQQTVAQGENAQQPTKQDQETIKVRSYTLPAATRIEQGPAPAPARSQLSTLNPQPSTVLSTLFRRAQFGWSATACRCGTTRAVP